MGELHEVEELTNAGPSVGTRCARCEPESHVALDGAPGQESRLLERDRAALVDADECTAVDAHRPRVGLVESGDLPEERGLATTGRTDERDDLPGAMSSVTADSTSRSPNARFTASSVTRYAVERVFGSVAGMVTLER